MKRFSVSLLTSEMRVKGSADSAFMILTFEEPGRVRTVALDERPGTGSEEDNRRPQG